MTFWTLMMDAQGLEKNTFLSSRIGLEQFNMVELEGYLVDSFILSY